MRSCFLLACLVHPSPQTKHSGKTSLLFHYAHTVAAAGGRAVILLPRPAAADAGDHHPTSPLSLPLPTNPPLLPHGAGPGDPAWARVSIKWVSSLADVQAYGACLHLLPPGDAPDAVLVDDVLGLPADQPQPQPPPGAGAATATAKAAASAFLPPPLPRPPTDRRATEHALARAMALLVDGVAGWRGGGGGQEQEQHQPALQRRCPGRLVVSVRSRSLGGGGSSWSSSAAAPPMMHLVTRWAPLVLMAAPGQGGFEFGVQEGRGGSGSLRAVYRVSGREGLAADGVVA